MSRIILACSFAAALLASGTVNANQSDWQQARRACADVAIDPSSAALANVSSISTTRCGTLGEYLRTLAGGSILATSGCARIVAWSEQQ